MRRQHAARLSLLKRRSAIASVLGFATMFGLAAHHTVTGSSSQSAPRLRSAATSAAPTTFFDQQGDGFAFDGQGAGLAPSTATQEPPVAQTSVS